MAAKRTTAVTNPSDRINELLAEREHLLELRSLTEAAPRSFEEAAADIAQTVTMLASRCEPQVAWLAQGPAGYADLARQLSQQDTENSAIPPAALFAWMMPTEFAAALKRDLLAAYDSMAKPVTAAAKHAELSRLQTELAAVETAIADAFWQATDSGLNLAVPDINGAALVGLAPA